MNQSDLTGQPAQTTQEPAAVRCSLAAHVVAALPSLRRYARFLTGSQFSGDKYAAATIEVLLADRDLLEQPLSPRIILFKTFHSVWQSSGHIISREPVSGLEARAHSRLASLIPNSREALLLFTGEEFNRDDVGKIMGVTPEEADALLQIAFKEMRDSIPGTIMIIEDEPLIAMDLRSIVEEMGHSVVGIATTKDDAIRLGRAVQPSLILSDIQLADNSSGVDAVKELLAGMGDVPTIFITAFPERLLTGEQLEPTFLIAKPFTEERVRSAVSQAMFFSSSQLISQP
ncbi:response regulator [Castellaniella sp.]|uniref:response regulator n=1 Tax=Castellaniella sp. TaxID=1955812 RepID=UPI002B000D04|nr:response regulator [Castellaniella sp.]